MPNFVIHGPFPVAQQGSIGDQKFRVVHADVPEYEELKLEYGCYIFCRKWGDRYKPWYVGKTVNSFKGEIFQPHKIEKLNKLREFHERGALLVFLIAVERVQGPLNTRAVDELEEFLIGECVKKNKNLLNLRRLPNRRWQINGYTNRSRGRPVPSVSAFKQMVG